MADPPGDPLAAARARNDQVAEFADSVRTDATGDLRNRLAAAARNATIAYIAAAGAVSAPLPVVAVPVVTAALLALLARLSVGHPDRVLRAALDDGLRLGADLAREVVGPVRVQLRAAPDLVAATAVARRARADLDAARAMARAVRVRRYGDVTTVLAVANRAASRVDAAAAQVAVESVAAGSQAVSRKVGADRVWVAERDACLSCAAYSGHVIGPHDQWPGGLTFGDKPVRDEPFDGPPLHPHCRCSEEPYLGMDSGSPIDLPEALRREAQRSVARGDSAYDSQAARLRAADRLVAAGNLLLPRTVVVRARRAVTAGRFPAR